MLRRIHDTRVFTGSHDVVYSEASERDAHHRLVTDDATSTRSRNRHHQQSDDADDASSNDDNANDAYEYFRDSRHPPSAQLHPQHPYNGQLRARSNNNSSGAMMSALPQTTAATTYERSTPMEFVYLPSGEIRPRDECPPGLALPPPISTAQLLNDSADNKPPQQQQQRSSRERPAIAAREATRRLRAPISASSLEDDDGASDADSLDAQVAQQRQLVNQVTNTLATHTKSKSTNSNKSKHLTQSNDNNDNNDNHSNARQQQQIVHHTASDDCQTIRARRSNKQVAPDMNKRTQPATCASEQQQQQQQHNDASNDSDIDSDESQLLRPPASAPVPQPLPQSSHSSASDEANDTDDARDDAWLPPPPVQRRRSSRSVKSDRQPVQVPHSLKPATLSSRQPAIVATAPTATATTNAMRLSERHNRRDRNATKLDVRELLSDQPPRNKFPNPTTPRASALPPVPSPAKSPSTASMQLQIERLEQQLQHEKQHVLDKTTQLLAEQNKNQTLQQQLDALSMQITTADAQAQQTTNKQLTDAIAQTDVLTAQVQQHKTAATQLQKENVALHKTVAVLTNKSDRTRNSRAERARGDLTKSERASAEIAAIIAQLRTFYARIEQWKRSSRDALDVCDTRADVMSLMKSLWLDFPAFPLLELIIDGELDVDDQSTAVVHTDAANEPTAHMLAFLKKRLQLREDELRQTHDKYVELKELCARQCVREADLQNFINEHRLRGNLVIRKDDATSGDIAGRSTTTVRATMETEAQVASDDRRVQFQSPVLVQTRASQTREIQNRATNTPPLHFDDIDDASSVSEDTSGSTNHHVAADAGRHYADDYDNDNNPYDHGDNDADVDYYVREPKVFVQVGRDGVYEHARPASSTSSSTAAATVLRQKQQRQREDELARRKRAPREIERIRLVPPPSLTRRYERAGPAPAALSTARRRVSATAATPTRLSGRVNGRTASASAALQRSSSATRTTGATRRKTSTMLPSHSTARSQSARPSSVSSRNSRTSSAPWV